MAVPNLNRMDKDDLWAFAVKVNLLNRKGVAELIGDTRKGYTIIARDIAHYGYNKSVAMNLRAEGHIALAASYEAICDRIYQRLPADIRW